jgi:hypothetical protein
MHSDAPPSIGRVSEQLIRSVPTSRPRIGFASVAVLALAASFIAWVLIDRNEPAASSTPVVAPAAEPAVTSDGPRISTVDGLSALAGLRGEPVYWAGPRAGVVYEVTESAGRVYVRYLAAGSQLGSPQPDFLTVATYPRSNAFADIEAAADRPGAVKIAIPDGLAVYDSATPTSVYLAYRGSTQQVEVYSPWALEARRLVESGRVRPVP